MATIKPSARPVSPPSRTRRRRRDDSQCSEMKLAGRHMATSRWPPRGSAGFGFGARRRRATTTGRRRRLIYSSAPRAARPRAPERGRPPLRHGLAAPVEPGARDELLRPSRRHTSAAWRPLHPSAAARRVASARQLAQSHPAVTSHQAAATRHRRMAPMPCCSRPAARLAVALAVMRHDRPVTSLSRYRACPPRRLSLRGGASPAPGRLPRAPSLRRYEPAPTPTLPALIQAPPA